MTGTTAEQAQAVLDHALRDLSATTPPLTDADRAHPFLCRATAARYLRGHKSVAKAAKALAATFEYRRLLAVDGLGLDPGGSAIVRSEMDKRGLYIAALSDGAATPSPVLVLRKREEPFDVADFEDYRRAFFYVLDCTQTLADRGTRTAENSDSAPETGKPEPSKEQTTEKEDGHEHQQQRGQWVVVMDMTSYKSGNSPPMSVTLETLRIVQRHFPERAKKIIILDAPRVFSLFWSMVRPFIDAATRDKFVFITRGDAQFAALSEEIRACAAMDMEEGKRRHAALLEHEHMLLPLSAGALKE